MKRLIACLILIASLGFGASNASAAAPHLAIAVQFDCAHVGIYVIPDPGMAVVLTTRFADYTTGQSVQWGYPWSQDTIQVINLWNARWYPSIGTHTYNIHVSVIEFFHEWVISKTISCTVNMY